MSNGAHQASGVVTYRVLRELGSRAQRTFAAIREPHELVVLHRFVQQSTASRETSGAIPAGATLVSSEQQAMLLRDALSLAKNWHPNIARVKHVDLVDGDLSIATELVEGSTLSDLQSIAAVRGKEFPLDVLVRVALDVLAGIHGIHSLRDAQSVPIGTIHGELCPTNIVVGRDGVARIVNPFRTRPLRVTARSEAVGYAAPETLDGGTLDARADVYAVGVILWEVLTGTKLHDEKEPARVLARLREIDIARPPMPEEVAYAPLTQIAMRALSFEPSLRFRTAMEMATALRALPSGRIATGSVVAARVNELDGERIRRRRAALDRGLSSRARVALPEKTPENQVPPVQTMAPSAPADRATMVPVVALGIDAAPLSSRDLVEEPAPSTVRPDESAPPRPPPVRPRIAPIARSQGASPAPPPKSAASPPAKKPALPAVASKASGTSTAKGLGGSTPSAATSGVTAKGLGEPSSPPLPPAPVRVPAPPPSPSAVQSPPAPASSNPIAPPSPDVLVGASAVPSSSPVVAPPAPAAAPVLPPSPAVGRAAAFVVEDASVDAERDGLFARTSGGLNASVDLDPPSAEEIAVAHPPLRRRALIVVAAIVLAATVLLVVGALRNTEGTSSTSPRMAATTAEPPSSPSVVPTAEGTTTTPAPAVDRTPPSIASPATSEESGELAGAAQRSLPAVRPAAPAPPSPPPATVGASPPASGKPAPRAGPARRYEPLGI